ncbi:MAG: transporter ATP-binding protein [Acidimicrobiaceae bacterium]|nr:transporter ATP-binding protein [Acidimicrobiaceae bacterium]
MSAAELSIRGLRVGIAHRHGVDEIVRGVDLEVASGEKLGVVGESGSGKTLTMLSVLQLLPSPLAVLGGQVLLDGEDLMHADERRLRAVRGGEVAMVYQDPMSSLNPLLRVGTQIVEALRAHGVPVEAARARTREVLGQVGLPQPERIESSFPHELSGGMLQRVMIAMALSTSPKVLIADEPTTALDVTIQQQILDLVSALQAETSMAVIWVTHDLGVVARLVDRVAVMYAGRVVEQAPTRKLFARPTHPYTAALLASLPGPEIGHRKPLHQIGGTPPDPAHLSPGCPFRARCPYAIGRCAVEEPGLIDRGSGSVAACWREPELWES